MNPPDECAADSTGNVSKSAARGGIVNAPDERQTEIAKDLRITRRVRAVLPRVAVTTAPRSRREATVKSGGAVLARVAPGIAIMLHRERGPGGVGVRG